jgi:hypothetical protein
MIYLNYGLFTPQGQSTPFSRNASDNYTMGTNQPLCPEDDGQ